MMKSAIAWLFLAVCIIALAPSSTVACSCTRPPVLVALAGADAVFTGRASDRVVLPNGYLQQTTFTVHAVWKGPNSNTLVVETPVYGSGCGLYFTLGTEYLVYAIGDEVFLRTDSCSRTKDIVLAEILDLPELGAPQAVDVDASSFGMIKALYDD